MAAGPDRTTQVSAVSGGKLNLDFIPLVQAAESLAELSNR